MTTSVARTFPIPAALQGAGPLAIAPDGARFACRVDGPEAGLAVCEAGGAWALARRDVDGLRPEAPAWSEVGDLLFRLPSREARVGVVPARGRGAAREYPGSAIAVSAGGGVLALADGAARALRVAVAQPGGSPFAAELRTVGALEDLDPAAPLDLVITAEERHVLVVSRRRGQGPSLWAFPVASGDAQEVIPPLRRQDTLAVAHAAGTLAVLEVRGAPNPSTLLYVQPLSPGSLDAVRLGPALDLLNERGAVPTQRLAIAPDGSSALLVRPRGSGLVIERYSARGGGKPTTVFAEAALTGGARFLASGEIAVAGAGCVHLIRPDLARAAS